MTKKKKNSELVLKLIREAEQLIILNKYKESELILNEVLSLDDNNPEGHYLLGEALCKQQYFARSVEHLKRANSLLPDHPRILYLLGWAIFMNGDPDSGRQFLYSALKKLPHDIQIICDLAVLENQQGNTDEAIGYATLAMKIEPQNPMVQEVLMVINTTGKIRDQLKNKTN